MTYGSKSFSNNFYPCLQRDTNFVIGIMELDVLYSDVAQFGRAAGC